MTIKRYAIFSLIALTGVLFSISAYADDIDNAFKQSYVYKAYLDKDDISVKSTDGVVTLTGTVSEQDHKSLAEDTVRELSGVQNVQNNLEVKGDVPAINSDPWIVLKVKVALLYHRSVSGLRTHVEAKDGVVTLTGEAQTAAEKELASEFAKDVEGVKSVNNEMTIATTPSEPRNLNEKIDDASITAQTKMALLTHRSTSAIRTSVKTINGVVTLTGTAKNQAEKDLVTKLVNDINGVTSVVNNMDIS